MEGDLGNHGDDAANAVVDAQWANRAQSGIGDDDEAPQRGGGVVVVDVGRREHEPDADGSPPDTDDRGPERSEPVVALREAD